MEDNCSDFRVRAYGKADLALLYNPGMCPREALRTLTRWILRNERLCTELLNLGYRKTCKILTPLEVGVITRHLGEP